MSTLSDLKRIVYKTIEDTYSSLESILANTYIKLFTVEKGSEENYSIGSYININYDSDKTDFFYFEADSTNNIYLKNALSNNFKSPNYINYMGNNISVAGVSFLKDFFYVKDEVNDIWDSSRTIINSSDIDNLTDGVFKYKGSSDSFYSENHFYNKIGSNIDDITISSETESIGASITKIYILEVPLIPIDDLNDPEINCFYEKNISTGIWNKSTSLVSSIMAPSETKVYGNNYIIVYKDDNDKNRTFYLKPTSNLSFPFISIKKEIMYGIVLDESISLLSSLADFSTIGVCDFITSNKMNNLTSTVQIGLSYSGEGALSLPNVTGLILTDGKLEIKNPSAESSPLIQELKKEGNDLIFSIGFDV